MGRGNAVTYQVFHALIFQGLILTGCSKAASIPPGMQRLMLAAPGPLPDHPLCMFPRMIMALCMEQDRGRASRTKGEAHVLLLLKHRWFPAGVSWDQPKTLHVAPCSSAAHFSGDEVSHFFCCQYRFCLVEVQQEKVPLPQLLGSL